jgi:hypothetical protein
MVVLEACEDTYEQRRRMVCADRDCISHALINRNRGTHLVPFRSAPAAWLMLAGGRLAVSSSEIITGAHDGLSAGAARGAALLLRQSWWCVSVVGLSKIDRTRAARYKYPKPARPPWRPDKDSIHFVRDILHGRLDDVLFALNQYTYTPTLLCVYGRLELTRGRAAAAAGASMLTDPSVLC